VGEGHNNTRAAVATYAQAAHDAPNKYWPVGQAPPGATEHDTETTIADPATPALEPLPAPENVTAPLMVTDEPLLTYDEPPPPPPPPS
jgi:hypothetical protein